MTDKVAIISVDGHVKPARHVYLDYIDPAFRQELSADVGISRAHPTASSTRAWARPASGTRHVVSGISNHKEWWRRSSSPTDKPSKEPASTTLPTPHGRGRRTWRTTVGSSTSAPRRRDDSAARRDRLRRRRASRRRRALGEGERPGGCAHAALHPNAKFFFDPALDPVWAACQETGLPLGQHGGTGSPKYEPQSFASFMVLATEHSFFSGRSLWQLILGGTFDRFPELKIAYIETEQWWLGPVMDLLDQREQMGDDWTDFAETLRRVKPYKNLPSDYWSSNCFIGLSPFTTEQMELDRFGSASRSEATGFAIRCDNSMIGVDYPHPETVYPGLLRQVKVLVDHPGVTEDDARKVLYGNAAKLFGFDLAALDADIDRAGFRLDDIPEPEQDRMQLTSLFEVASVRASLPIEP